MVMVSVIMPAYNSEKYIDEAIQSIVNQTYKDFEFIIINDGSIDNTLEKIKKYDDSRIKIIENEKNLGIVKSLNKGLSMSKGKYIVRMDSDDISIFNRIEKQVEFMEKHSDVGVLGTNMIIFGENVEPYVHSFSTNKHMLKAEMLFNTCIAHPTTIIRTEVLKKHGLKYNEYFCGREDFVLWWEIARVSNIAVMPEALHKYRIHNSQETKKVSNHTLNNTYDFLMKRLDNLNLRLSSNEIDCLFKYCIGDYDKFTSEEGETFIHMINKIILNNKTNKYFNEKYLKRVCSLAINYIAMHSFPNEKEKYIKYAQKLNIYPLDLRVKMYLRKLKGN